MHRPRSSRTLPAAFALALACAVPAAPARAADTWWSIGALAGATQFDRSLADFQWDASARAGFGAEWLAGRGPLGLGLRTWRSTTTQSVGGVDVPPPDVHATRVEAMALVRVANVAGLDVHALASGGRLHLGYAPDQATFEPTPGGTPVTVSFAPVDAWAFGAGTMLRALLVGPWSAGLTLDRQFFSLDTAHRNGDAIDRESRSFGDWNARFEIAWNHRSR